MNHATLKTLFAVLAMAASGAASASAVTLVADQLRTGGGTLYTKFFNNPAGGPVSTATWDWNAATGVLTQTGGVYYATRRIGSVTGGAILETDMITGLVIDTVAGTTTATTYSCIEGTFGAGVGAHICGNVNFGDNFAMDSPLTYNFGGNADCVNKVIAGDDLDGGPLRGLTTHAASGGCAAQLGAYMRYNAVQAGGQLLLNNGIPIGSPGSIQFAFIPVPAAVWLFGSALGVMGLARRKVLA
jgi:hypothetical protein